MSEITLRDVVKETDIVLEVDLDLWPAGLGISGEAAR
jgi:hypothetical protein